MQKSLLMTICLFVLSLLAQEAIAGDDERFNSASISSRSQPQMLTVANMVPDLPQPMAQMPTSIVNANLNARPDAARIMPKMHNPAAAAALSPTQSASGAAPATAHQRAMSATEQANLKNYAPFMRNLVMSADTMAGAKPQNFKAARVMKGGKQVIVLGGP